MLLALEIIVTVVGGLALIFLIGNWTFSAPYYRGPITNHFNGKKFCNLEPAERKGFIDFLRWQLTSRRGHWNKWTDSHFGPVPQPRVNGKDLRVTFVNHATVLIQRKVSTSLRIRFGPNVPVHSVGLGRKDIDHPGSGLKIYRESMSYSSATIITIIWTSRH